MTVREIQLLVNLRTHMLSEARTNYKHKFGDNIWCVSCKLFPSSQEHLFNCYVIRNALKKDVNFKEYSYDDIYGSLEKQEKISKLFIKILETIQKLTEENQNSHPSSKDHSTEDLNSTSESDVLDTAVFQCTVLDI